MATDSTLRTSVTRLQTFRTCRRKSFLQDILRLVPSDVNAYHTESLEKMSIGTVLHQVFEDSAGQKEPVISDEQRKFMADLGYDIDITCNKYLQDFAKRQILAKEAEFELAFPEYNMVLHARVDEIYRNEAGQPVVVDHKTTVSKGNTFSKHHNSTRFQLLDYCTIIWKATGTLMNHAEVRVAKVYSMPIDIPRNNDGSLRKRVAGATHHDYIRAITKYNLRESDYAEVLERLKLEEAQSSESYSFYYPDEALEENYQQLRNSCKAFFEEFSGDTTSSRHFLDILGANNSSCNSCMYKELCEAGRFSPREHSKAYMSFMYTVDTSDVRRPQEQENETDS